MVPIGVGLTKSKQATLAPKSAAAYFSLVCAIDGWFVFKFMFKNYF